MKAKKIEFPVVKGKSDHWPKEPLCPVCGKNKILEPHSMAILCAGALLMNRKENTGVPSNRMDGFLDLAWHGAHDGGKGKVREIYCVVEVIKDVIGGQADLCFCSTKCLRRFLNTCVDQLEASMRKA